MSDFESAAAEVKNLKQDPTTDEKLALYGLYKIGKGEEAKKAGMFDIEGKKKFEAFTKEKEAGTTKEDAQKKYVAMVEKLKATYGTK